MTEPQTDPNTQADTTELLRDHTCETPPDQEGRITPACSQCWSDAHEEGRQSGALEGITAMAENFRKAIRDNFNPLDATIRQEAISTWETATQLLKLTDTVEKSLQNSQHQARRDHIEYRLARVIPRKELEKLRASRNNPQE